MLAFLFIFCIVITSFAFPYSENPPFSLSGIARVKHDVQSPGCGGYIWHGLAIAYSIF
jgi:hypothetical protein